MNLFSYPSRMQDIGKHRQFIYGFAALMIMFFHMGTDIPSRGIFAVLSLLKTMGCAGVEIFLLLSGFGLNRSFRKNSDLDTFYARRMMRVLPPLAISALFFDAIVYQSSHAHMVQKGFALDWMMSSAVWYVSFIVLMYLLYPLIYKIQQKKQLLIWVSIVGFALCSFALEAGFVWAREAVVMRMVSRVPVFLLGCALAPYELKNQRISRWFVPVLIPIALALIMVWKKNLLYRCAYSQRMMCFVVCAIIMIIVLSMAAEYLSRRKWSRGIYRCIAFCGGFSLELYLVFARVRELMELVPALHTTPHASLKLDLTAAAMSIVLSFLLNLACKKLTDSFCKTAVPEAIQKRLP